MRKTLAQALKGMKVKNWEIRENSKGHRVVYVRFVEKEAETTVTVEGASAHLAVGRTGGRGRDPRAR